MALLSVRVSYYNRFTSAVMGLTSQLLLTNQLPTSKEDIWSSSVTFGLFFIIGRLMCRGIVGKTAIEQFHQIKVTDRLQDRIKSLYVILIRVLNIPISSHNLNITIIN